MSLFEQMYTAFFRYLWDSHDEDDDNHVNERSTHITLLLDESGSMWHRRSSIIDGFNQFIKKQREIVCDRCTVSTYFFNSVSRCVNKDVPLADVQDLTLPDYNPNGPTALRDALGDILRGIRSNLDQDTDYIVAILTDGEENSSTRTSKEDLDALINDIKDIIKITYLGSNQDAVREGTDIGATPDSAIDYADEYIDAAIESLSSAIGRVRTGETQDIEYTALERDVSCGRATQVI